MAKDRKPKKQYAIYRGDTFLDLGTAKELGEKFGVKPEAIRHYAAPSYRKRIEHKSDNRLITIAIEDD